MCLKIVYFVILIEIVMGIPAPRDHSNFNSTNTDEVTIKYDENNKPYIDLGNNYKLQLELEEVTGIYKEKAEKILGETPENVEKSLKELRELLRNEKNLYIPIDDDSFLKKFLRPMKYNVKETFKRIKSYYQFRIKYKTESTDLLPSKLRKVFETGLVQILPKRDLEGRRVYIVNIGKWDPDQISKTDLFRGLQLGLEAALLEPMTQVNGVVFVEDLSGLTFSHILEASPSYISMGLEFIDSAPIYIKALHVVNNSYLFSILYNIVKPFMDDELKQKIMVHRRDYETMSTAVGKHALAEKYGGTSTAKECPGKILADYFELFDQKFKEMNSYGYNKNNN